VIIEVVTDGVWVTDDADRLICFNPAMERLAGVSAADMLGLSVVEDFPAETTAGFLKYYLRAKRDGMRVQYEADVVTPAGRRTVQAGWLTPRYSGDTYEGMICTIQDVTERRGGSVPPGDPGEARGCPGEHDRRPLHHRCRGTTHRDE
jgi:PAS domain S-box-containing protein